MLINFQFLQLLIQHGLKISNV